MRRILGNFVIIALVAIAITAVLAITDATDRTDESAAPAAPDDAPITLEPAPAIDVRTDATPTDAGGPATPDHLQTDGAEAQVLGAVVVQETESNAELAETGPLDTLRWIIVASGVIAAGGMVRGAGRDHARGGLSLMG
ncbi:MAG: hypothetical protein AAGE98_21265 [Actinomycetota bacterium]